MKHILLCFCFLPILVFGQTTLVSSDVYSQLAENASAEVILFLGASQLISEDKQHWTKNQKAEYVFKTLQAKAETSQVEIIEYLQENQLSFTPFLVANAIKTTINEQQLDYLIDHFEIKQISFDQPIMVATYREESAQLRMDPEWGIQKIEADSVWQLGFKGEGVVIAGQDTGYDFDNALILPKYRGYSEGNIDHNHNWHDAIREINPLHQDSIIDEHTNPCGLDSAIPCDDHGHGTHTMGTMVGEDEENKIGVAPEASWIACRNMERGYGTPSTYLECFEFFLAPTDLTGANPNPSLAPHVINNSWGCPPMEGCNMENFYVLEEAVNNLVAAGTVVVASAGNNGASNCGSVSNPAAIFEQSFTIGSTRDNDTISGFSSIGPVMVDSSYRIKPDVAAPGQNVRSIYLNDEFRTWSGTSMAGPHVAGAVALIINANPSLAGNVDEIRNILKASAVPLIWEIDCDGVSADVIPNIVYGNGRIDVYEAVQLALNYTAVDDKSVSNSKHQIFPNPVDEAINIKSIYEMTSIRIFDAFGNVVSTHILQGKEQSVNLASLQTGVYFYELTTLKHSLSGKIIKL